MQRRLRETFASRLGLAERVAAPGTLRCAHLLPWALAAWVGLGGEPARANTRDGGTIYRSLCASCHGPAGEGVADKYDEPLYGTRSVESLARLIHRTMPEDDPQACVDEDAQAVAAYIYEAFYSPEARTRNHPPRRDLVRLTNRQYLESIADLIGGFQPGTPASTPGGLRAEYFQSKGMNKKDQRVLECQDTAVAFEFGDGPPIEGITPDQFSIAWNGSLLAPDTGEYGLRLSTPNGARLYLNVELRPGDANRRDDSDARRQDPLIDLWVSSGGEPREVTCHLFLLGGRAYPLRLDYFKYKETNAAIRLEWRPPGGVWSVIPARHLSPATSPPVTVISAALPPDDGSLGYERGSAVSKAWHDATTRAAVEVANLVAGRLSTLSDTRRDAADRTNGLRTFAVRFVERAFRRPLTEEVRQLYVDEVFAAAADPEQAVKRVVLLALTSPRFLYPDLEEPVDDHTVAARLALALWDSLPDQALREAAEAGALRTREQVRDHARRMAADPRARAKLRDFLHHWLALESEEEIAKDTDAFPGFDAALVADLRASLDQFLDAVVWSDASDQRQLLLADYVLLNARLANFYGLEPPSGEVFARMSLDREARAGVLTHPYMLATLSYHRSTSPIHRGVFLTRNVLGRFLKPPPMAIEFMDDRFDPSLTMREKVTELTKSETCMACHVTINPLGFSLEHFDAVGRHRLEDNGKPVNAEAEYLTTEGEVLRLRGPRDLAEHAAASEEARLGFVRQMFQYVVKQPPAAYGPDVLSRLDTSFQQNQRHIRELFMDVASLAALSGLELQAQAQQ